MKGELGKDTFRSVRQMRSWDVVQAPLGDQTSCTSKYEDTEGDTSDGR